MVEVAKLIEDFVGKFEVTTGGIDEYNYVRGITVGDLHRFVGIVRAAVDISSTHQVEGLKRALKNRESDYDNCRKVCAELREELAGSDNANDLFKEELFQLREESDKIAKLPDVAARLGVGEGTLHDAVVALVGALVCAEAENERLLERLQMTHCPRCDRPTDNGNDRCVPPNAYVCSRCEQLTATESERDRLRKLISRALAHRINDLWLKDARDALEGGKDDD